MSSVRGHGLNTYLQHPALSSQNEALEDLHLEETPIKSLPESIGELQALKDMHLEDSASNLRPLPTNETCNVVVSLFINSRSTALSGLYVNLEILCF